MIRIALVAVLLATASTAGAVTFEDCLISSITDGTSNTVHGPVAVRHAPRHRH